jgi:Domain of unknown function (DUF1816)
LHDLLLRKIIFAFKIESLSIFAGRNLEKRLKIREFLTMLGMLLLGFYFVLGSLVFYYFKNDNPQQWWIEIKTKSPKCTYYFGLFDSEQEAEDNHKDYIEDLQAEGAREIKVRIGRYQPKELTIFEEEKELAGSKR